MIHIPSPIPEPEHFDTNCRKPGEAWLADYPGKDPKAMSQLWLAFQNDLAEGFKNRCGYLAMWIPNGEVDHFLSCKHFRSRAFDWHNYRWLSGPINRSKGTLDDRLLDPYEVQDGWFEVHLPSFLLLVTDQVPEALREKAAFTISRLKLSDGARDLRWNWYCSHWNQGNINMDGLYKDAPLVALAVERAQEENRPLPDPEGCRVPRLPVRPRQRPYFKRSPKAKKSS